MYDFEFFYKYCIDAHWKNHPMKWNLMRTYSPFLLSFLFFVVGFQRLLVVVLYVLVGVIN